ncbi:MAG: GTP cyclohydrolase II [Myxococcota bacterium]|nr:GTP cyclohydrolase II [Myxococcota bacterium]
MKKSKSGVTHYAETRLPTSNGDFTVHVFRHGEIEHLAIVAGEVNESEGLPVRVHSECLTGEVLGSLKCDCKAQLDGALERIKEYGQGVVVYLRQEGRGIGLGNKIRAYRLQEDGVDTVDANRLLGFEDDLRDYTVAADILSHLGVASVALMTNNPLKIQGLEDAGVVITGREPHIAGVNDVNLGYLETKRDRMGHMIDGRPGHPAVDKAVGS